MTMAHKILITGGAGFIGSNLAHRLLGQGHEVTIFDNLSRPGCNSNIAWLRTKHGPDSFRLVAASVTDFRALREAAEESERIYHLAGQVAVTRSVRNPRQDFEDNALGTFNALEAARSVGKDPIFIYAGTNKVYGRMDDVALVKEATRYRYADLTDGVPETQPLDFHSPYGCSKGAGDQYTRDYARIYGLRAVVARQSCIYGYRQFGVEDQGWVAWFMIAALTGQPITIFGDGRQVRDVLFVEDLLDAYDAMVQNIQKAAGQVYNVGGGPENSISVWAEFGQTLEDLLGHCILVRYASWRPGDQDVYISNISKARRELGWEPRVSVRQGIVLLLEWMRNHQEMFTMNLAGNRTSNTFDT